MSYPSDLSDAEWRLIERHFRPKDRRGSASKHPRKRIVDAILAALRTAVAPALDICNALIRLLGTMDAMRETLSDAMQVNLALVTVRGMMTIWLTSRKRTLAINSLNFPGRSTRPFVPHREAPTDAMHRTLD